MTRLVWSLLLLACASGLFAKGVPQAFVKKTEQSIRVDGVLDEDIWLEVTPTTDFWQHFPADSIISEYTTVVYMAYNDEMLYVAAKCYAPGTDYIVPSLQRDYRAGGNDNITFLFDPFNDGANAFVFGMNPLGVRREALITEGGISGDNWNSAWDNKWEGASMVYDDHWSVEIAIPFKTLRFNAGSQRWRFNCYRFDTQSNEIMSWFRVPRNQSVMNLAFMGNMIWEEPLEKAGPNIAIIPYAAAAYTHNRELEGDPEDFILNFGGDAKVALTPGLNLDLTANPDFSQVEVDQQLTNLTRFELFFPERRQFFIENSDLFGGFGRGNMNPFFSRRIGIVEDTATEANIANTILAGARLNGKVNDDMRIGFLNMTTQKDTRNGLPYFNYTVAAVQHKVFSRSNIGAIFVNKQALRPDESNLFDRYNRMVGIDYNILSPDNRWTGKVFFHKVLLEDSELNDTWSHGANIEYQVRKFRASWSHAYIGENFDPQVGFVPRKNLFRIDPEIGVFFYPKKGAFNIIEAGLDFNMFFRPGFGRSDHNIALEVNGRFKNNQNLFLAFRNQYTYLFEEFDPTRAEDAVPLPDSTGYNYWTMFYSWRSDQRKNFWYNVRGNIGEFFNGIRLSVGGNASYRFQPFGSVGINYNINYVSLPEPYATETIFLVGPRVDLTFSRNFFFSAVVQWNEQIDNVNINTRLQWRYAPVSDLFIVYTDNYGTDGAGLKNRSLVAKVTYWLNV